MNYRTNFVIFGMIHQHVIFFMKYHFLGTGVLRVNHTTVSTGFSNIASVTTTYLCQSVFSALAHIRTKAQNQQKVENGKRLALSNTQPRISKLATRLLSQPSH